MSNHHLPPFEAVVQAHGPSVLRVCRAVLGPDSADDAWSETFLAALRAYPELPAGSNVQAWLVRIAHRKSLDQFRSARRRPLPVAEPAEVDHARAEPVGASTTSPPSPAAAAEAADLWAAVARLPQRQRLCVAYHYLGGLSYPEIAELLGGTATAARRAGADGIAALRRRTDLVAAGDPHERTS